MSLNSNARAPRDRRPVTQTLGALQIVGLAIEPVAGVDDNTSLVGLEISADSGEGAGQGHDNGILGGIVDKPVAVVALARAASTAVSGELRVARGVTELDARSAGKVIDGAGFGDADLAGGKSTVVSDEVALGVGHVESVVPDPLSGGVLEGVQVEVGVLGKHNGWEMSVSIELVAL